MSEATPKERSGIEARKYGVPVNHAIPVSGVRKRGGVSIGTPAFADPTGADLSGQPVSAMSPAQGQPTAKGTRSRDRFSGCRRTVASESHLAVIQRFPRTISVNPADPFPYLERDAYFILPSRYSTCLRTTGSYFRTTIFSVILREFFRVT